MGLSEVRLVRAETTYTFGSLVRASARIVAWITGSNHVVIAHANYMFHTALYNKYSILFDSDHAVMMDRLVRVINGTAERGVECHADMDMPHPLVSAYFNGPYSDYHSEMTLTARAYGPVDFENTVTTGTEWMIVEPYTGDRGMAPDDHVKIGSHNYRFVETIGEQSDRVLLELGQSEEENVAIMRDRLVAAINADPAGRGIVYGSNTVKNLMIDAEPGEEYDEVRIVCTVPGLIGNEIELKDTGDGAFSRGATLSGGGGDFQDWIRWFVDHNEVPSHLVQQLQEMLMLGSL